MKNKITMGIIIAMTLIMLATNILAVTGEYVKINGDIYESGDNVVVERGEKLEIKMKLQGDQNTTEKNLVAEVDILGYEHGDDYPISDSTEVFDLEPGDTVYKTLTVTIPENADRDYYDLRVRVAGRTGTPLEDEFRLRLQGLRHEIIIKDILLDDEIMAGRGLFVNAKLKNLGEKDEQDITVKVEISDLNLVEYTTVEELEADEGITTEDVVLLIPECTKSGTYEVEVTVDYNDYDTIKQTKEIEVTKNEVCQSQNNQEKPTTEKTIINVPSAQEAKTGESAAFPIMITNQGAQSKVYTISVSGSVDAVGTYRIDPSNVVIINAGQTKTVYVYIDLNDDAQTGPKDFAVTVKTGAESESIPLTLNVIKGGEKSALDLTKALMIAFVVLLIILLVLGLIWGFNKIKGQDQKEDEEVTQTYY